MNLARISLVAAFVFPAFTHAQQCRFVEESHEPPGGQPFDRIGAAVDIEGMIAVIGAPQHDSPNVLDIGAAHVYLKSGASWVQQAMLLDPGVRQTNDHFGSSVALSGETIVVGTPGDNAGGADRGAIFVFARSGNTWSPEPVTSSPHSPGSLFGTSVAIDGNTIVVGAPRQATAGTGEVGAAYVFIRSGSVWTLQAQLLAADGAHDDEFGTSVAISGNTVLVGAPLEDRDNFPDAGSAYIFTRAGGAWTQQAKLTAMDAAPHDSFGFSVALSGDRAVIGAPNDSNAGGSQAGAAYAFVRTGATWGAQAKLTAPDAGPTNNFGWSTAIDSSLALIGAPLAGPSARGKLYTFIHVSGAVWASQSINTPSASTSPQHFGWATAVSGNAAIIGAPVANSPDGMSTGEGHMGEVQMGFPVFITQQPESAVTCAGGSAEFSVVATGTDPLEYVWEIEASPMNWLPLSSVPTDLPCGGSATATPSEATTTVTVVPCTDVSTYQIRAVITNVCGSVPTNTVTLTICPADFNCNGRVNSADFFNFLTAFFSSLPTADFNNDALTNSQDFFDFLAAFFAGC
ncbi:MAG: FG-GAP repeat protein [Pyrinomonadaceae bacterium]|nr:FG-GAP repeat protein [Phycisphaerales bacterium]